MSEAESRESSQAGRWVLWVAVALVGYVLSVGPVGALTYHCWGPITGAGPTPVQRAFEIFYTPLGVVADHVPSFNKAMNEYGLWWFRLFGFAEPKW
jgi:hypothetical protein